MTSLRVCLLAAVTTLVGAQDPHWLEGTPHFTIGLLLEKLDVSGARTPLYAKLRVEGNSTSIALSPTGQSPLIAPLVFDTGQDRYVMPAGYRTNWVTVAPPPEEDK